jgi:hypothetical protein
MSVKYRMQGFFFMFADHWFKVKPLIRSNKEQSSLDRESRRIQLYFSKTCPASIKIKRRCQKLGLRVVEKDVERVNAYRNELIHGGGVCFAFFYCRTLSNPFWLNGIYPS